MMDDWALGEIERRLAGMIRLGTIAQLDEAAARVKVSTAGLTTDWLPWITARAGGNRTWHAPEVGEQVLVLSPFGDPSQAVALPSIFQDAYGAPAASKDIERTQFGDGGSIEYNRASHRYTIDLPAGSLVTINAEAVQVNTKTATVVATDSVKVDSPQTTVTGKMNVQGLFTFEAGLAGKAGPSGGAAATIQGGVQVTGGDFSADGYGLKSHKHSGVQAGGGTSGTAVP